MLNTSEKHHELPVDTERKEPDTETEREELDAKVEPKELDTKAEHRIFDGQHPRRAIGLFQELGTPILAHALHGDCI